MTSAALAETDAGVRIPFGPGVTPRVLVRCHGVAKCKSSHHGVGTGAQLRCEEAARAHAGLTLVSLAHVLENFVPGSGEWDWHEERRQLSGPSLDALVASMYEVGYVRAPYADEDPITLGDDGRVWDGHHRILAAFAAGGLDIPVLFGFGG